MSYSKKYCCCCSVVNLYLTLPHHELQHTRLPGPSPSPKFAQTHIHWVGDAIQPSHPLPSPSPPALNLSQHQSFPNSWLSTWGQSIGASDSASVLPMSIQGCFPLGLIGLISLLSKGFSRVSYSCCFCCQVTSIMFNSVRPHRRQPTRLLCPQDSLGRNTGVGCHVLLHLL